MTKERRERSGFVDVLNPRVDARPASLSPALHERIDHAMGRRFRST